MIHARVLKRELFAVDADVVDGHTSLGHTTGRQLLSLTVAGSTASRRVTPSGRSVTFRPEPNPISNTSPDSPSTVWARSLPKLFTQQARSTTLGRRTSP